ncbi:MAG: hypothetical protein E7407_05625 [Ruminococcaceae bacterium]|nr:hypothetical protein [Oscillospiraceae bacterium]
MITKKEVSYPGFGKCLELSNGTVSVVVTLDFGPRIIRYSFVDGENIMFEDTARDFYEKGKGLEKAYGKGSVWYIYGGHRLWSSPEDYPGSYYPDNEPIKAVKTEKGAVFTPEIQRWNQYGCEIEVELEDEGSSVCVLHRITNYAKSDITLAPWSISALSPGGTEIVPLPVQDTEFSPNRHFTFWPDVNLRDERVTWLERYMVLKQDKNVNGKFKMGVNSEQGYALYFNNGDVFLKQFEVKEKGIYPDGGMSFETYTNQLFLEMESLGELKTLGCGKATEHKEKWALFKGELPEINDDAIEERIKKLLKHRT